MQVGLLDDSEKQYETAEPILRRSLDRPNLQDRTDLLERLADMYDAWGKPAERDAAWTEIEALQDRQEPRPKPVPPAGPDFLPQELVAAPIRSKLGRNDPCRCGSGLKYKRCHLRADRKSG